MEPRRGQAGFEDFCRREHPRLVGLLGLYCGERILGEELAQEALARALRDWKKVARMDHPAAWLSRVGINLANSHFRRRSAERRANDRLQALPRSDSVEPDDAGTMSVRAAVSALPRRQREVLVLRYYGDLSFKEIAGSLGMPEPTVKSLVRRALMRLRAESGLVDDKEASNVS